MSYRAVLKSVKGLHLLGTGYAGFVWVRPAPLLLEPRLTSDGAMLNIRI